MAGDDGCGPVIPVPISVLIVVVIVIPVPHVSHVRIPKSIIVVIAIILPTLCGGQHKGAAALQVERNATEGQEVAVASDGTQRLGARLAEVELLVLLAELLCIAGGEMAVHAVVSAVAVAALLALPVRPEGLVGGQLPAHVHAAAVAPCHALAVPESVTLLALAALGAGQWARLLWLVQVGTGQGAVTGALLKVAALRAGQSCEGERETDGERRLRWIRSHTL